MHTTERHAGFSLLEVVLASTILAVSLTAGVAILATVAQSQKSAMDRRLATELAYSYLEEILGYAYDSSSNEGRVFILSDSDKDGSLNVALSSYGTVDDFDGSDCQPPCATDGTTLSELPGVRRIVSVHLVAPDDLASKSAADEGLKLVTVIVEVDGKEMAHAVGLKARHD